MKKSELDLVVSDLRRFTNELCGVLDKYLEKKISDDKDIVFDNSKNQITNPAQEIILSLKKFHDESGVPLDYLKKADYISSELDKCAKENAELKLKLGAEEIEICSPM